VREKGLPTSCERKKNTDCIYFHTGVVNPKDVGDEKDVWVVAVMPSTPVYDQRDNDAGNNAPPTSPISLGQHLESLHKNTLGFYTGTPLFPEIRIPVDEIPLDTRFVKVNPDLDEQEYRTPWWILLEQKRVSRALPLLRSDVDHPFEEKPACIDISCHTTDLPNFDLLERVSSRPIGLDHSFVKAVKEGKYKLADKLLKRMNE